MQLSLINEKSGRTENTGNREILDSDFQVFEEWTMTYLFWERNSKLTFCIIWSQAVLKEFNILRHYETKHTDRQCKRVNKSSQKAAVCLLS